MSSILSICLFLFPSLALCISGLGFQKDFLNWKRYYLAFVIAISMFALFYYPKQTTDLTRYLNIVEYSKQVSLKDFFSYYGDGLIIRDIWFWICGRLNCQQLMPFTAVLITYLVSVYLTCDIATLFQEESLIWIVLIFQILLLPLFTIADYLRSSISISLILIAVYYDVVKKRRKLYVFALYIIPCLLHVSAILLLAVRLLLNIKSRYKWLPFIFGFFIKNLIDILYSIQSFFSNFGFLGNSIQLVISRAYYYFYYSGDNQWEIYVASSNLYRFYKAIVIAVTVIILYCLLRNKVSLEECARFKDYIIAILLLVIVLCRFPGNLYLRYFIAVISCISMAIIFLISELRENKNTIIIMGTLVLLSVAIKVIQVRLDLWSVDFLYIIESYLTFPAILFM